MSTNNDINEPGRSTTKARDTTSRNLLQQFMDSHNTNNLEADGTANVQNYDSSRTNNHSSRLTNMNNDRSERYLSPTALCLDNDPVNTSDCMSFPHYIVSPTPEKVSGKENSCERQDQVTVQNYNEHIKDIIALSSEKDSLITLGKDHPVANDSVSVLNVVLSLFWLILRGHRH